MVLAIKKIAIIVVIIVLGIIYIRYNPESSNFFPKCPFYALTGLKCPGCGSQRTIHYLLHFDFAAAFRANALLVISIPYIVLGLISDHIKNPKQWMLKWRKILFGKIAIAILLIIIILFWLYRNNIL